MCDINKCKQRLKQLESQARYDTDPDIKLEIRYYKAEIKRLKRGGK